MSHSCLLYIDGGHVRPGSRFGTLGGNQGQAVKSTETVLPVTDVICWF